MDTEFSHYFQEGSPFLPDVDLGVLNTVIRDLTLEQGYFVGEAIAKGMGIAESISGTAALFNNREDATRYFLGFTRPTSLLMLAYIGLVEDNGIDTAKTILSRSYRKMDTEHDFLFDNLPFAVSLLSSDPTGVEFMNELVSRELSSAANLYYKIGLEAARRTFIIYLEILDTLIPQNAEAESSPNSIFFCLFDYEKYAPTSTKVLSNKARELEKALARLVENPSCGTTSLVFLRYPMLIPKLISNIARFIYRVFKNPDTMEREISKTVRSLQKAKQTIHNGWQPGQLISDVAPAFAPLEESLLWSGSPDPHLSEKFTEAMERIRALNQRADDNPDLAKKLLEEWEQLAELTGFAEYPALWTAVYIAFGNFSKKQFVLTGEKAIRYIKIAKEAYAAPLKLSALVQADLGTRRICAAKLGNLYCKYFHQLELPTIELARAIHDTYFDVLTSNERLYQRSPYRESREKLQDSTALAVARTIETCVYLGQRSETEEASWFREAVLIAENGKSRMLRGEVALSERLTPSEIPLTLINTENNYLKQLRTIYTTDLSRRRHDIPSELSLFSDTSDVNKLRLELETLWSQMDDFGETARAYVTVRRDEGIQWDDLRGVAKRLGEKFALVSIHRLPDSVFLSVFREGWKAPKAYIVPLSREKMQEALRACHVHLTDQWQSLGDLLFTPLLTYLSDVEYVYFFPHGPFNLLPLHALTIGGKPFIKQWAVIYAPSVSILESSLSRSKCKGDALIMGYANRQGQADEMILQEAVELMEHFQTQLLLPELCNSKTLKEHSSSSRLIHLACHGKFIAGDPLDSHISLADGPFTARDWLGLDLQADLVTLSACESGVSEIRLGGDPVGLLRAILFAGASSVLTTLWAVNSFSTLEWMLMFYHNLWNKDGLQTADKAISFQKATIELMRENRDPHHWAPFVLVGNYA